VRHLVHLGDHRTTSSSPPRVVILGDVGDRRVEESVESAQSGVLAGLAVAVAPETQLPMHVVP